MRGAGIRPREGLISDVAFVAQFVQTTALFADSGATPGFFPMLGDLYPPEATGAAGQPAGRLSRAVDATLTAFHAGDLYGGEAAAAFVDSWGALEMEVAGAQVSGPLDVDARRAGEGRCESRGLQRAITAQVEQVRRDRLHADLAALPVADPRRAAWVSADRYSSQFLTALPTARDGCEPLCFQEIFTTYLGVPSRLVAAYVGRGIPCGSLPRVCDAMGFQLGLASLPGGGHTAAHDEAMRTIFDLTQEAGLGFELEPRHVFTSLIDPATLAQLPLGATGLPSIIPDFLGAASMPAAATARVPGRAAPARRGPSLPSRVLLWDVKLVFGGGELYRCARARDEQAGAVAERAHRVGGGPSGGEYGRHARALDLAHSPAGTTPIVDRLTTFGQVRALVFGQYAETSPDVDSLVLECAYAIARKRWRLMGARSEAEARSYWVGVCRRRVGVAVARAMARFRIRRSPFLGVPRAVLDERARRGALGLPTGAPGGVVAAGDEDVRAFYMHQVHERTPAD